MEDGTTPIDIPVEAFAIHEGYDANKKINDIAILKLKTKVPFSRKYR